MVGTFPTSILLATDGSRGAALAARAAADLSTKTGSKLHFVHVWQDLPPWPETLASDRSLLHELKARELLETQTERLEAAGAAISGAHLRPGRPADEIVRLSGELGVGLLVIGSRGLGRIARLVLGSVSEGIVYLSSCPTLVMRGGEEAWPPARIVIGDDSSEEAKRAAEMAASIGKLFEAQAFLVRASYPEPAFPPSEHSRQTQQERAAIARMQKLQRVKGALQKRAGELEEASGLRPHVRGAVGDAAVAILEVAGESGEATLIAVGRRGFGKIKSALLGSVSTKVLRAANGPVLIAP